MARRSGRRRVVQAGAALCLWLLLSGVAWANNGPPELRVRVALSGGQQTDSGVSIRFKLLPFIPGSDRLPALHTIRLSGDVGALNLRGVPTCRPSKGSSASGCRAPMIGGGRVFAFEQSEAEGGTPLKRHGGVRLYSGGQRGATSRIYAQVFFPGDEANGGSFVIPMTVKRKGPARSELTAMLPAVDDNRLSIGELLLTFRNTVQVGARSIVVTSVGCPSDATAEVRAEVSFYNNPSPSSATTQPECAR